MPICPAMPKPDGTAPETPVLRFHPPRHCFKSQGKRSEEMTMILSRGLRVTAVLMTMTMTTGAFAKMRSDADVIRQQAEHDCYDDAQKLCPDAVPDEDKITACMTKKRAQLSTACGKVFDKGL